MDYRAIFILIFFIHGHFSQKNNYLLRVIALYLTQNKIPKRVINILTGFGLYLLYKNTK